MYKCMSGRSVSLYGARRGYLLTDDASISDVASVVDSAPPKESRRMFENHVDMVNRNPHLLRGNTNGAQCFLVLSCLHGIEQAILVEKQRGSMSRKMTCVPIRFDSDLHQVGVVFSGVISREPYPCLVLEDVIQVGKGNVSTAGALDRAMMLYNIVHEKHRADPFCQPFPVKCARFLSTDMCDSRSIWRSYPHSVGSLTLCSMMAGYPDLRASEASHSSSRAPTLRNMAPANKVTEKYVKVIPMDAPDVYKVLDSPGGTLVVKSLADSQHMNMAKIKSKGNEFEVKAKWDLLTRKWTLSDSSM